MGLPKHANKMAGSLLGASSRQCNTGSFAIGGVRIRARIAQFETAETKSQEYLKGWCVVRTRTKVIFGTSTTVGRCKGGWMSRNYMLIGES
mmetsp:Transcript_28777/g.69615  ORF Transcript_28777/g.69615 Transcript_28777/m.69615 type:complete len:91 (+) Transcript_28777:350-622(+)